MNKSFMKLFMFKPVSVTTNRLNSKIKHFSIFQISLCKNCSNAMNCSYIM